MVFALAGAAVAVAMFFPFQMQMLSAGEAPAFHHTRRRTDW
jgi:hypothetical protein